MTLKSPLNIPPKNNYHSGHFSENTFIEKGTLGYNVRRTELYNRSYF